MGEIRKRTKDKMKILQFLTIFSIENIKISANDIEDITLERLLTYFKYEVCLAKGVDKKVCNNVATFLKSDCLKRADPGPCAALDNFMVMTNRPIHAKNFTLVDVGVTEISL